MFFLVAFVATFVLSRAAFWLMRSWDGGMWRLLAAHAISLALCWAWFAFGSADGKVYLHGGCSTCCRRASGSSSTISAARARGRGEAG
jgi:hypothetical protein